MHVDMDAFFASVEQRDNPEFRHRPVIVGALPGGRGVVATCSYEARAFGIRSAMPISEAWRRCPGAIYLRPDMPRYVEASRKIMQLLQSIRCQPWRAKRRLVVPGSREAALLTRRALRQRGSKVGIRARR
ncbi:MAG: DNA polymerase IV, partial [gamma proteobacterium endosymbiont of Lamellibrachia anaximandri]|nr:DNA polymerase IV [gamma proteobacterium endosymbiont of Lamellibrachia anaximandri]